MVTKFHGLRLTRVYRMFRVYRVCREYKGLGVHVAKSGVLEGP